MKQINLIELGKMLSDGFNNDELDSMVFNIDATLGSDLDGEVSRLPKSKKVAEIIRFAKKKGALEQIVDFTKTNNSYQYNRFQSSLYSDAENTANEPSAAVNSPVSNESSSDIKYVVDQMAGLMREMIKEGTGKTVNIHAEKVNYSEGGNVTDNSIGSVGDGATIAQGSNAQAHGGRSVAVGGNNSGNIITGDHNTVTTGPSAASDDMQSALKAMFDKVAQLEEQVESSKDLKIIKKVSSDIAQELEDEILDEAGTDSYIERLTKAANNVGAIAKPVVDAAIVVATAIKASGYF